MLTFPPSPMVRIFVGREPVDMPKGFDGLSAIVVGVIDEDPQSGHLFVFFNKRRDKMKALVWDDSGFWVIYKRLEHGRFLVFDRVAEHPGSFELDSTDQRWPRLSEPGPELARSGSLRWQAPPTDDQETKNPQS